jgi:hypothetical protein
LTVSPRASEDSKIRTRGALMVATELYMVVFRLIHILAGVVWAGSVFMFVVWVQPSVAAIAPAGAPFMGELLGKRRLVDRLLGAGGATIVAGLFIYWHDWHLYDSFGTFVRSRFGLALTIGALCAIGAYLVGAFGTRPKVQRMLALGAQLAAAPDSPPAGAAEEMKEIQRLLPILARTSLALLIVAIVAMSTARYL